LVIIVVVTAAITALGSRKTAGAGGGAGSTV